MYLRAAAILLRVALLSLSPDRRRPSTGHALFVRSFNTVHARCARARIQRMQVGRAACAACGAARTKMARCVEALYAVGAADTGQLSFAAGDIIEIINEGEPNQRENLP